MASITLKNVSKIYRTPQTSGGFFRKRNTGKYKEVVAVKDFSIDIKDKEFIVLLGPSGCGK